MYPFQSYVRKSPWSSPTIWLIIANILAFILVFFGGDSVQNLLAQTADLVFAGRLLATLHFNVRALRDLTYCLQHVRLILLRKTERTTLHHVAISSYLLRIRPTWQCYVSVSDPSRRPIRRSLGSNLRPRRILRCIGEKSATHGSRVTIRGLHLLSEQHARREHLRASLRLDWWSRSWLNLLDHTKAFRV